MLLHFSLDVLLLVDVFLGVFLFGGDFFFVYVVIVCVSCWDLLRVLGGPGFCSMSPARRRRSPARRDVFREKCAGMVPSVRKNTYRTFECLGPRREPLDLQTVAMKVSVFEPAACFAGTRVPT